MAPRQLVPLCIACTVVGNYEPVSGPISKSVNTFTFQATNPAPYSYADMQALAVELGAAWGRWILPIQSHDWLLRATIATDYTRAFGNTGTADFNDRGGNTNPAATRNTGALTRWFDGVRTRGGKAHTTWPGLCITDTQFGYALTDTAFGAWADAVNNWFGELNAFIPGASTGSISLATAHCYQRYAPLPVPFMANIEVAETRRWLGTQRRRMNTARVEV